MGDEGWGMTITSMVELRRRFNIVLAEDEQFFTEWFDELLKLTEQEQKTPDHLKQRFLTYRDRGPIPEGVVDKLLVTPLLDGAGFYDEPQALAYTMATPHPERPVFGVVTNGDEFTFIAVEAMIRTTLTCQCG
jgi:hypothetical protein